MPQTPILRREVVQFFGRSPAHEAETIREQEHAYNHSTTVRVINLKIFDHTGTAVALRNETVRG
jgi:hypothetical protein